MTPPAAVVETEAHGDHVIVRIIGELDVFNAESTTAQIELAIPNELHGAVLDLTAVGFLDSTAIRKLFGLTTRLTERRQSMLLVTPEGSTVRRTLQLVDFSRAAPMFKTLEAALASIAQVDSE